MPRQYTRKTDRAPYTDEKLQEAIQAVKNGSMTAYVASKQFAIPRPTIVNRLYGRRGIKSNTLGRRTILPPMIEESLAYNLHIMEKYGFGLTRKEILEIVGEYVNTNCINNPFTDGKPGKDWFAGFKKRHCLSIKKPQPVEYARKHACRPDIIYPYFDLLENTMNELNLHDKPGHIYNLDETSFSKDPSKSKVVGLKGFTSTRTISSPGKDNTTVLLGCNALGEKLPPLIIYKGKNVWDDWTSQEAYPGTVYASTANGWMESHVFETFFDKVFLPTVGQKRPILLIYDGHSTHVGINIIEKARAAEITIIKIPPHTSDVLQPLDLSVNKSFKDKWDIALVKWQRQNVGKVLPKKDFAKMIGLIWTAIEPAVCSAGFRKAGIYPLNKNAVPPEKFNQMLMQVWNSQQSEPEESSKNVGSTLFTNQYQLDAASYELWLNFCDNNDNLNLLFQEQDELGEPNNNQPVLLKKIVLDSINKMISGSYGGTLQQSCNVLREANHLLENKPSTSHSLNEPLVSSVRISQHHDISLKNKFNTAPNSSLHKTWDTYIPKVEILENRVVTFEDLLLKSVKCGTTSKAKKRKIATGAELITNDEVYERCKILEAEKEKKVREKQLKAKEKEEKSKAKELLKKSKQIKKKVINIKNEKQKIYINPSDLCTTIQEKTDTIYSNALRQEKISKGKGAGKSTKISKRENTLQNPLPPSPNISKESEPGTSGICTLQKTKKRNQIVVSDSSTTSISDIMSDHTDSSIFDVESDNHDDEERVESERSYERLSITKESSPLCSDNVSNLPISEGQPINISGTSVEFPFLSSDIPCLNSSASRDISVIEKYGGNNASCLSEQDVAPVSNIAQVTLAYLINDKVLVRYFIKNRWKYYIGVVTACNDNGTYEISYYTTFRNKGELKFKMPKRKDWDTVPQESVVKIIEITKVSENTEVYTLSCQDDIIYF